MRKHLILVVDREHRRVLNLSNSPTCEIFTPDEDESEFKSLPNAAEDFKIYPFFDTMMMCDLEDRRHMVDDTPDMDLTTEDALKQLRRAVAQRLKSGPHGLLRCWIEFRQRAGSTKGGITLREFARGLRAYGIPLSPDRTKELFGRMDVSKDGLIQIKEFIDHVMGRWSPDTNTHFGNKSVEQIQGFAYTQSKARARRMIDDKPDEKLTIDAAVVVLRKAIAQRLKSGPNGLMRCWFEFRLRAGSTYEGITLAEFARGLRCYGIPLTQARTKELFEKMDVNNDGHIQISEFIDVVMGRWNPASNSGGMILPQESPVIVSKSISDIDRLSSSTTLTADDAILLLRGKISQRLSNGSHSNQRAWKIFRNIAGGTHAGVTYRGLERVFFHFGLPIVGKDLHDVFRRMGAGSDNLIRDHAFARIVMGRYGPAIETIPKSARLSTPSIQKRIESPKESTLMISASTSALPTKTLPAVVLNKSPSQPSVQPIPSLASSRLQSELQVVERFCS